MKDIEARVIKIIAQQLNAQEDKIRMEDKFLEDLNADSLDIVELLMALEDEFGIKITDEEAESLTTVGAAINFIEGKSDSAQSAE